MEDQVHKTLLKSTSAIAAFKDSLVFSDIFNLNSLSWDSKHGSAYRAGNDEKAHWFGIWRNPHVNIVSLVAWPGL